MTFAERFRQIADMSKTATKGKMGEAVSSALKASDGHAEESTLRRCLIEALAGKTEIGWEQNTPIPDSLKNEGFWLRYESSYTKLSFDTAPENSTTAEPTA